MTNTKQVDPPYLAAELNALPKVNYINGAVERLFVSNKLDTVYQFTEYEAENFQPTTQFILICQNDGDWLYSKRLAIEISKQLPISEAPLLIEHSPFMQFVNENEIS